MLDRFLSNNMIRTLNPAASRRTSGQGAPANVHPTTVFPRYLSKLKDRPKPTLLDLGLLCGENIALLAGRGVKVFVDDVAGHLFESSSKTITMPDGQVKPAPVEFSHLTYPARFFDGMILWNLIDFMNRETASRFLERLQLFMKPRCLIFAMSSYDRNCVQIPLMRYRIVNENEISYEKDPRHPMRSHILENRELHDLFSRFEIIKSNLLRNQVRELLIEKK